MNDVTLHSDKSLLAGVLYPLEELVINGQKGQKKSHENPQSKRDFGCFRKIGLKNCPGTPFYEENKRRAFFIFYLTLFSLVGPE